MSLVNIFIESKKRSISKTVHQLIKKTFLKVPRKVSIEEVNKRFMLTYCEVTTNDIDVEFYFESLYICYIDRDTENTPRFIIHEDSETLKYTIKRECSTTHANRHISYLDVYLDFKVFDNNTFIQLKETNNCCISFTIRVSLKECSNDFFIEKKDFELKTLEIRDIDFYRMILSVDKLIVDLESKYEKTHWFDITIEII